MSDSGRPRHRGRRKRPRVPLSERKRAVRACLPCRHHKEKCEGDIPCARCKRYGRTCQFEEVQSPASPLRRENAPGTSNVSETISRREHHMMRIIRHFVGDVSTSIQNLEEVANGLDREGEHMGTNDSSNSPEPTLTEGYSLDPLSANTMHYSGEFSHWNFSRTIRRRLESLGNVVEPNEVATGSYRATGLQSTSSFISLSMMYFPPREVANFLTDTFLEFAQTNYFYFDEMTFRQKMELYYANTCPLTIDDAGWVCTLLMTFAIGTQFAYMQTKPVKSNPSPKEIPDDHVGLELYRFSCRLIPDLITVASVETVQAFLLLGVYTLTIDTSGLAYTYYGLAIKMAIQNGLHRKFAGEDVDQRTVELRNRLWWSAYSLESRISILHGRPVSISRAEIDADQPSNIPELQIPGRVSNLPNMTANIYLTRRLGDLAAVIIRLRRCPRHQQAHFLQNLMNIRSELRDWWSSLPTEVTCRDLNPQGPLFRCNVHLELNYATATLYMGRPFIFMPTKSQVRHGHPDVDQDRIESVKILAADSLNAAFKSIYLCQLLQDSVGLARMSYTEFSSSRAALLALIAHSITGSTDRIRNYLTQGMGLIRQMCIGLESAQSEVAVIEAMERAMQRLDRQGVSNDEATAEPRTGYDQFKQWARLWAADNSTGVIQQPAPSECANALEPALGFDGFLSSFPQELDAFAAIPGQIDSGLVDWPEDLDIPIGVPDGNEWAGIDGEV